jgi:DNA-binding beta-propeller fold protein YncE
MNTMRRSFHKAIRTIPLAAALLLPVTGLLGQHQAVPTWSKTWVNEGVRLQIDLHLVGDTTGKKVLSEGDLVKFDFHLSDEASKKPLTGAYPAAWMDIDETEDALSDASCRDKIETFLGGGLLGKADIDLNGYQVITLNEDGTLTVVDPLFGYGGTKLLALVQLGGKGKDWVQSLDARRMFVSIPERSEVVVIDADKWEIEQRIPMSGQPNRLRMQSDGQYLWVANEGNADGLVAINAATLEIVASFATGRGPHDLVLSADNRWAFVSNHADNNLSIIDIPSLRKVKDLTLPAGPGFIDWSEASQALYISHQQLGQVSVVDPQKQALVASIPATVGITRLRFAPGGRYAFIVNPSNDYLYILDAATNRIVQDGKVEAVPDFVTFTDELAYVRHRGSPTILMVPLRAIGQQDAPIPVVDFPGGDNPAGNTSEPSLADGIIRAPGAHAVLVANPLDKSIYFYKEGMAAPMGSFSNYGRSPLAVAVVDRSLKEKQPGHYETIARIRDQGRYSLVFYLDAPKMGACFEVEVGGGGPIALQRTIALEGPVKVTPLFSQDRFPVGKPVKLDFALHPHDKAEPITGLEDVQLLATTESGRWHQQLLAAEHSKVPGVYRAEFTFPKPGIYFLHIGSRSQGLEFNHPQFILVQAVQTP